MKAKKEDRLLTTKETAEVTGYSRPHIYQLVESGELEAETFLSGKRKKIRIRESVARAYGGPALIPNSLPAKA